jgi:hypothetical protein
MTMVTENWSGGRGPIRVQNIQNSTYETLSISISSWSGQ